MIAFQSSSKWTNWIKLRNTPQELEINMSFTCCNENKNISIRSGFIVLHKLFFSSLIKNTLAWAIWWRKENSLDLYLFNSSLILRGFECLCPQVVDASNERISLKVGNWERVCYLLKDCILWQLKSGLNYFSCILSIRLSRPLCGLKSYYRMVYKEFC